MKLRIPYWATQGFDIRLNGRSVASHYQPGSYFTLPTRRWTKRDTIEVVMPFTWHLDFGPDKMEVAATGKNEPSTRFEPAWCAAVMYGPLVMAKEGVKSWEEATVKTERGSCVSGSLNALCSSRGFIPDYVADHNVTHYFRILMPGGQMASAADTSGEASGNPDTDRLMEAMALARSRRDAQDAWLALDVKVPEYAPWAKHGYARMMELFSRAQVLLDDAHPRQSAVDAVTAELNAALSTMRPGNLPELEDLDELLALLGKAKEHASPSAALREAIQYAEMVVRYVSDGSGTHDMIDRAVGQLKAAY